MGACASDAATAKSVPAVPPKPPKPSSMRLSPEAAVEALKKEAELVASNPPVAPPKPRSLQGKDSVAAGKKDKTEYRSGDPNKGPSCITVPSSKEETSKDGSEKFQVYVVNVKLLGGKTHSCTHRFSEFATFHKEWQKEYPGVAIELPPKRIGMSDEDISKRCGELQVYLREMCEVSALIYPVAKFLGLEETELKAAVKGKTATSSAMNTPTSTRSSNGSVTAKLPKVSLQQQSSYNDQDRYSTDKPKLPKVRLQDVDGGANTPPRTETPPPKPKAAAIEPARNNEHVPPPPQKVEAPPPPPQKAETPSIPPSRGAQTQPASKAKTPTPIKTSSAAASSSSSKSPTTPEAKSTAIPAGGNGERVMSVKERMAAFQKNGK